MTKYHILSRLNDRNLFSHSSGGYKSKSKVKIKTKIIVSFWQEFSSWLCFHQMAVHLPCGDGGRENCLMSLFIRTLISSWGSYLMISSKPDCLPKAPSPVASILRYRVSTHEFWRYTLESIVPLCSIEWLKMINKYSLRDWNEPRTMPILWALYGKTKTIL